MSEYMAALTTVDTVNHVLTWDTDGYYVVGDTEWQDIILETTIEYNGGSIGVAPRVYSDYVYMTAMFFNDAMDTDITGHASLQAQLGEALISLGNAEIDPLVEGTTYTVRVEIRRSNYKIYLNDKVVFNIEYASMSQGRAGIYGTAGTKCSEIEVNAPFADGWTTNVESVPGGIIHIRELDDENKYLYIKNTNGSTLYARQTETVVSNTPYTLSFNYKGSGTARIIEVNGAVPKTFTYTLPIVADWTRVSFTDSISPDCTSANVYFFVGNSELMVNEVQYEQKLFATDYIHNESTTSSITRESSYITYPSKNNIDLANGSLSMWVKPTVTHSATMKPVLLEYGDANGVIRVSYTGNSIRLKYGVSDANVVDVPTTFIKDTWYHIVAMWSQYKLVLFVNNVKSDNTDIEVTLNVESDIIRIGHGYTNVSSPFLGVVDETIMFKNEITEEMVEQLYLAEEPISNISSMIMRATFNHAIGSFNKSSIEATLAPAYGSPIVVEKEDGTPMQKVSFYDYETGEYRTYNIEEVIYDGESDYLEVSYDNLDTESFTVSVRDADGVIWGDPHTVDGNRISLDLTDEQKDDLYGKSLFVSYQLENAFTVDFNIGVPDSFRINVGKHDGQGLKIVYEGNDFTNQKLATMIEMNPLLNPNHEGFLYITKNVEKVSSFRAKATPEDLHANGASESLLVVEPLDMNGNFISHAKLMVTANKGTIIPNYDRGSILSRERAGRYMYKYRAPKLYQASAKLLEVQDHINIIDKETGLGIQIPITLKTIKVVGHTITSTDTLDSLADMYGTTIADILTENKMDVIAMEEYLKTNVGQKVRVPESYIEGIMTKAPQDLAEEAKIVDFVNNLIEYIGEPVTNLPTGLGAILDFNGDGLIGVEEFTWINDNKGKKIITTKHEELLAWLKNNVG